jgi:hypothetical protein
MLISWVEECQVTWSRLHGLKGVALQHLRMVRIFRKLLSPCLVVLRSAPLSIVDECVTTGHLVEEDVSGKLRDRPANRPAHSLLHMYLVLRLVVLIRQNFRLIELT